MKRVLLVDDDVWLRELYGRALEQAGFDVVIAPGAQEALDALDELQADCIVLDLMMPGHNGIEVLHELQSYTDWRTLPVFILSTIQQSDFYLPREQWGDYGVADYLYKPHTRPRQLVEAVSAVTAAARV